MVTVTAVEPSVTAGVIRLYGYMATLITGLVVSFLMARTIEEYERLRCKYYRWIDSRS